jgi:Golgi nucleoside diphosphatase
MDGHPTGIVSEVTECNIDGGIAKLDSPDNDTISKYLEPCFMKMMTNISVLTDETSQTTIPVYFAATAGMRMLNDSNPEKATKILDSVQAYITSFHLDKPSMKKLETTDKLVDIISGYDEGFYAWLGANYLTGSLFPSLKRSFFDWLKEKKWFRSTSKESLETSAVLDLGGASTQVVFEVKEK